MNDDNGMAQLISEADAALLRSARELLWRLGRHASAASVATDSSGTDGWARVGGYTRMVVMAEVAENAIFDLLNTATHHGRQRNVDLRIVRGNRVESA